MTKTRGSILLVDDEAKIRTALADALREEGHEVVSIGSPREAQRLLARGTFDVLIVDNLMPELTGLDLIRELVASTPAAALLRPTWLGCSTPTSRRAAPEPASVLRSRATSSRDLGDESRSRARRHAARTYASSCR